MFDSQAGGPDAATTLSLVARARRMVLQTECQLLELAAHWSDLHHSDSQAPAEKTLPGAERGRVLGGEGTPEVLEFAAAELASCLHTSIGSARALMADGLDLRHRLPQLWQHILTGAVPAWKARKVAQATRHLSRDSAMQVDAAVAGCIATLPWGRLETLLAAKIIEADPKAAEEQARIWEAERFVRTGRTGQAGLKLLIAKANAGDVIWFMATLNRIAEILRLQGDLDSAEVRRSKAIGILAQPALALQLLWDFRGEQHPAAAPQQPEEPIHNQPKAPYDHSTTPPDEEPQESAPQASSPDASPEPRPDEPESSHGEEPEAESNGCDKAQPPHHDDPETQGHGLIIRPTGVDLGKLRPQVVLHIHLSQEALWAYGCGKPGLIGGVARFEGVGPLTLNQVRRFLTDTGCQITVQPVIDPQDVPPVDGYEIPRRIREAMFLRMPASCFPYATKNPTDGSGPHQAVHTVGPWWPTRPNRGPQPGPVEPTRAPHQNAQPMAGPTTRTRCVDLAITP